LFKPGKEYKEVESYEKELLVKSSIPGLLDRSEDLTTDEQKRVKLNLKFEDKY